MSDPYYRRLNHLEELPLFRVRTVDQTTSAAAAASLPKITDQHRILLIEFERAGQDGLTDEEAADRAGLPVRSCWWKRCGELRSAGLIRATGATRKGQAGRERIVSVAVRSDPG